MSEELPPPDAEREKPDAERDRPDAAREKPDAEREKAAGYEKAAGQEQAAAGRAASEAAGPRVADADAWATATAEDLEAEKARRRAAHGPPPGSAAEELRRLVDTVADKLSGLRSPLLGPVAQTAAQQVVKQVVQQARAAVEPVIERNPDVFDHLAAAGGELLAAYRSAVQNQERRWTTGAAAPREARDQDRPEDDGGPDAGPGQRIDLD